MVPVFSDISLFSFLLNIFAPHAMLWLCLLWLLWGLWLIYSSSYYFPFSQLTTIISALFSPKSGNSLVYFLKCCSVFDDITHKWWAYCQLNRFELTGMVYYNHLYLIMLLNDAKYIHILTIFSTSSSPFPLQVEAIHNVARILLTSLQM